MKFDYCPEFVVKRNKAHYSVWLLSPDANMCVIKSIDYAGHAFHYDIHDFKSLTLFVYLSDVQMDSCPHVLISGTHKRKSLGELRDRVLNDKVARKKFRNRITAILGSKGTAFLEDTTAFHKVADGIESRLMLSIHYVLRRRVPPERPLAEEASAGFLD